MPSRLVLLLLPLFSVAHSHSSCCFLAMPALRMAPRCLTLSRWAASGGGSRQAFTAAALGVANRPVLCSRGWRSSASSGGLLAGSSMVRMSSHGSPEEGRLDKVIVISGPTAAGKSSVAMAICERLGGEIVSADSVQVYSGLEIGSNQPSKDDLRRVRHHLVSVAHPSDDYTAGVFVREANVAIRDILSRGKVPVVVGGTMLYLEWLVEGIPDAAPRSPEAQKQVAELVQPFKQSRDWAGGRGLLEATHPEQANALFPNDWYRLSRALEVVATARDMEGGAVTAFTGERKLEVPYDFRTFFVTMERMSMCRRIDERCEQMLQEGLLDETAGLLLSEDLRPDSTAGRAIGYRQALEFLQEPGAPGHVDFESESAYFLSFFGHFAAKTRRYAQQQLKWFRSPKGKRFLWVERDEAEQRITEAFALEREAFEGEEGLRSNRQQSLRDRNLEEGKKMKTYRPRMRWLIRPEVLRPLVTRAVELRRNVQQHQQLVIQRQEGALDTGAA